MTVAAREGSSPSLALVEEKAGWVVSPLALAVVIPAARVEVLEAGQYA